MNYIIFDLDHTLLDNTSSLSHYTLNTLKILQSRGFILVINTARSKANTENIFSIIQPNFAIYFGGSLIVNNKNEAIYEHSISQDAVKSIYQDLYLSRKIQKMTFETNNNAYSDDYEYVSSGTKASYLDYSLHLPENTKKIIVQTDSPNFINKYLQKFNLEYVPYLTGNWGRISPCSKYKGNHMLFSILNDLHPYDYTFGDDLGDLEMIQKAYHGVLLSNARDDLKSKVLRITSHSNNEDGVARYLEFLLKK